MRSRKLLALLFCLITFPAIAGYMTLLGAGVGSIAPVVSWVSGTDAFPSTLSFSRTSNATMFDSTGKLTYAPNNLLTQSNTFSNAAWTKTSLSVSNANAVDDPFGGTNATTITATGANGEIYQSFASAFVGATALPSIWVRRRTGSGLIRIYAATGTPSTVTVTGSWTQIYVNTINVASGTVYFGLRVATSGDAIDIYAGVLPIITYETTPRTGDQVITTSAAYYGPRIDYDPNTLAVKGLLIEEARTNQNKSSADIAGAGWTAGAGVTIGAATTAPDGTSNAKLYQSTGASDGLYNTSAVAVASPFASSVFLKYGGTGRWFLLRSYGTGGAQLWIDLLNGVIGTSSNYSGIGTVITPTITPINNGWYRLTLGTSAGATHNYLQINSVDADNSTAQANGTAYVWGAQTEAGSFATSYIPTAAASVTRAADVVQFTGAALTALQGSAATFVGQTIGLPFNPAANSALVAATAGNSVIAYVTNSNAVGVAAAATYNGAAALTVGTPNYATTMRIGSAFSGSGRSLVVNGGSVATDANAIGSRPAVYLGGTGASLYLNGWMQSFAIYNQRLPDATLQAKSVVGASYAANDNGLRFADNDNLPIHWRVAL